MLTKILYWLSNIGRYIDYLKGHAARCDFCHEIVYGWFGTDDGKRKCMRCAEANGPTMFTSFVKEHTEELLKGKINDK